MSDLRDDGYDVGFGKPPKSGQFQKGKSGNPKGRPKGTPDLKTILRKLLSAQVTITENGRKKRVSTLTATVMRLNEKALKGDMRAIEKLLSLAAEMAAELEAQREARSLGATDKEVMERFRNSVLAAGTDPSHEGDDNAG
jgi:hypothetical protein